MSGQSREARPALLKGTDSDPVLNGDAVNHAANQLSLCRRRSEVRRDEAADGLSSLRHSLNRGRGPCEPKSQIEMRVRSADNSPDQSGPKPVRQRRPAQQQQHKRRRFRHSLARKRKCGIKWSLSSHVRADALPVRPERSSPVIPNPCLQVGSKRRASNDRLGC